MNLAQYVPQNINDIIIKIDVKLNDNPLNLLGVENKLVMFCIREVSIDKRHGSGAVERAFPRY